MQTIWNNSIGRYVEVPDEAVDAYLRFPQYSREEPAPAPDPAAELLDAVETAVAAEEKQK